MHRLFLFFIGTLFFLWSHNIYAQTLLFSDSFESGYGNWSNVSSGDNKDWTRDSGGTTSSGTGPSTGADGSIYYVYLETSSGSAYTAGDTAILQGPSVSDANIHIVFQYHMYGADMGTLAIDVLSGGSWINDVWSISGQQQISNSDAYATVDVDLSAYVVSQVRFRATAAGGYRGDMAIDNVELWSVPTEPVAPTFTTDPVVKSNAYQDQAYSDSIASDAMDANGDPMVFTKISGPDWLSIAEDGELSGTPDASDVGQNSFLVEVSDGELTSTAIIEIYVYDNMTPVLLFNDDFESGFGNWSNVTSGDNNNWTRDSAGTSSSNTGPSTGADGSTYYVYLETSSGYAYYAGDTAILEGPAVTGTNIHVIFQYHMYGTNIGTLAIDVLSDGSWINDVWSISGQQQASSSEAYATADVNLSGYAVSQIRFRATAAGGYMGDMAIDNIELWNIPTGPTAPVFNSDPVIKSDATQDQPYSDSLAADAVDANGDQMVFSKVSGPDWLDVAEDGGLSGTPEYSDVGLNSFVVEVSDGALSSSATININVTPPILYSDDFELGFGNWSNVTSDDDYNWTRYSGSTTSSSTGPSSGAGGSTYYVYFETSSGSAYYAGDTAILLGPVITDTNIHIAFEYHMYGTNTGTLSIDILSDGSWINDVWSVSGQQQTSSDDAYTAVDVDLSAYTVTQIRIRATAAGGYMGDIAIDNVEIRSHTNPNDLDGDGVLDTVDLCPNTPSNETADSNGCSPSQIDSDNDGVPDIYDAFPQDPTEWIDTDLDGIGNNADTDDDADGVPDADDTFPLDSTEWLDTDGDGLGNNADTDDDNDSVNDVSDAFPLDSAEWLDTDNDGIGNNADTDDDNDGVLDVNDDLPIDGSESVDTDNDGIGNNADTDDDGDGVLDINDDFPLDATESLDTDGDGIGNNADTDDDNDGVLDVNDDLPLDSSESVDTDNDGIGNNADTDDDGDGVLDINDDFPLDATETLDTDGDGIGNNADTDDDGDNLSDADEINIYGTDPLSMDSDNDGMPDGWEVLHYLIPTTDDANDDNDGDGISNIEEYNSGSDPSPPMVDSTDPVNLAVDVSITSPISITFTEEIEPTTLTSSAFTVSDGVNRIDGIINIVGITATFYPNEALSTNTIYTVFISQYITDLSGNNLGSDFTWTFTTVENYSISGQITFSGQGLDGVILSISGDLTENQVSDSNGQYIFENIEPGNYILTPSLLGYTFTPESITVQVIDNDITEADFEAVSNPPVYVPNDYSTIQGAVDAAVEGVVIYVDDGVYNENIIIDKALTIESINGYETTSIVAANVGQHVFTINAAHVKINGFDISGAHNYYRAAIYFGAGSNYGKAMNNRCGYDDTYHNYIGVYVSNSDNMEISNNICNTYGPFGIYVVQSSGSSFIGNIIEDHGFEGISLQNASFCTVANNTITLCRTGIKFRYSDNVVVYNNNTSVNTEHGIHILDSGAGNTVTGNTSGSNIEVGIYIESSGATTVNGNTVNSNDVTGVVIYSSNTCTISENTVNLNSCYGIYINNSDNCTIDHNNTHRNYYSGIKLNYADNNEAIGNQSMSNQRYGIELYSSTGNSVSENITVSNDWGIYLNMSSGNTIFLNSFERSLYEDPSVFSSSGNINTWVSPYEITYIYNGVTYTGYVGNFYAEHTLTDSDGDGITDTYMDLPGSEPDDEFPMAAPLDDYQIQ